MKCVLVRAEHPGNIGAVARVLANFGFKELVLVNPQCDHLSSEACRRAKHGLSVLKAAQTVASLDQTGCDWLAATSGIIGADDTMARIPISSRDVAKHIPRAKNVGIVFGPESTGLCNEELEYCDVFVHIPSNANYPILNLSQAVGIIAYELAQSEVSDYVPVPAHEKEVMLTLMDELIDSVEFETSEKAALQKTLWRRVLGKALLTRREAFGVINLIKKSLQWSKASGEHGDSNHQSNEHGNNKNQK